MLTKKQLEDALRCCSNDFCCDDCSMNEINRMYETCNSELARTALIYLEMLEKLEWYSVIEYCGSLVYSCPICGGWESAGHHEDCELVKILGRVKNEQNERNQV